MATKFKLGTREVKQNGCKGFIHWHIKGGCFRYLDSIGFPKQADVIDFMQRVLPFEEKISKRR